MKYLYIYLSIYLSICKKDGTGGGGWVHLKGTNSMAVSGLCGRKVLVGTGRAISIVLGINGLCRASISSIQGPIFSYGWLPFLGRLNCKFINWWVWLSQYVLTIAEYTCESSFEPSNG